ncbi:ethanolamine kinase 1-like [Amblyraja radiata]|uniref:ethanolamine kinase 1-like n=1 Tax=Amblyraja radiata TaxID=386614 RepID=UPI001404015A|nr:ethanolamine kinase 1-like [Amblyraja radiata]
MERSGRDHPATATKHLDLLVDEKEPRKDIERLLKQVRPLWKPAEIKLKIFTSGITNRLVGCYVDRDMEEVVLVRIYGNMTELYVDHDTEVKNFQLLHAHNCSPELYCTFQNGICYEFIKGEVLDMQQLRKPSIFRLVARAMAQFHSVQSDNNDSSEPNLWTNLSKYLTLLKSSQSQLASDRSSMELSGVPSFDILITEIEVLKEHLLQMKSPLVLCHNDLLCNNIIHVEEKGEVKFIDYEYAGYNYQAYDIGNHFNEFAGVSELDFSMYPPQQLQLEWLRSYLEMYKACTGQDPEVTELEVQKLYVQANKFALASHLSWGLWALLQTRYSTIDFDFPRYTRERFKEYFKRKDEFLALELPC